MLNHDPTFISAARGYKWRPKAELSHRCCQLRISYCLSNAFMSEELKGRSPVYVDLVDAILSAMMLPWMLIRLCIQRKWKLNAFDFGLCNKELISNINGCILLVGNNCRDSKTETIRDFFWSCMAARRMASKIAKNSVVKGFGTCQKLVMGRFRTSEAKFKIEFWNSGCHCKRK